MKSNANAPIVNPPPACLFFLFCVFRPFLYPLYLYVFLFLLPPDLLGSGAGTVEESGVEAGAEVTGIENIKSEICPSEKPICVKKNSKKPR